MAIVTGAWGDGLRRTRERIRMIPAQPGAVAITAVASALPSAATPPAPAPWRKCSAGDALALALLVFWATVMLMRVRYGFECFDEGMYLSTTDRLVRGDLPFRDDQENPLSAFNLLLAAIERPFGGFGLIAARSLGAALQMTQMAALWLAVRRCSGAWTAALAACLVPCLPLFGIWAPGYNEISCTTTVVGGCLLALAGSAGWAVAILCGLGAGVAFGLGVLAYVPTLALGVVPMAMAGWGCWRAGRQEGWRSAGRNAASDPWCLAGASALAAMAAIVAGAAWLVVGAGLGGDWWAAVHATVQVQDDANPLAQRLGTALASWFTPAWHLVVVAAGLAVVRHLALRPRAGAHTGWAAALIILALLGFVALDPVTSLLRVPPMVNGAGAAMWIINLWYELMVVAMALALVFTVPAAITAIRRGTADGAAGLGIALAVFTLSLAICALASSTGGFNGLNIRAAVLAMGAAGLGHFLRDCPPACRRPLALAALTAHLVIATAVGCAGWLLVYKDSPPSACTATFTHAPLAGVHSTPEHVRPLTALQEWVAAHEPADARCIAYHDAPILSFALGRRPALARTWTSPWWSWSSSAHSYAVLDTLVQDMVARGRRPDFCVRQLIQDREPWPYAYCLADPLHAFVCQHFYPVWRTWPYEVLVPRDAHHPDAEPAVIADPCASSPFAPSAQVIVAQGVELAPDGAGGLLLSVPASDQVAVACQLLDHGGDEVSLRLRIDSDSPELFTLLARDQQFSLTDGRMDGNVPGWDVTFPAGTPGDRGFALGLPPSTSSGIRRIHIRRLCLERFAPVPGGDAGAAQ